MVGVLKATTVELLPERIDLLGLVLQGAGFFAILGTAALLLRQQLPRRMRRLRPEHWTVGGAALAGLLFAVAWLIQEVH